MTTPDRAVIYHRGAWASYGRLRRLGLHGFIIPRSDAHGQGSPPLGWASALGRYPQILREYRAI